jgi:hypothetical protein
VIRFRALNAKHVPCGYGSAGRAKR